jgi:formamidopyrimidine-DNA glycosylase
MPELPEVQTVVSDLNKKIVGDTITDFWSDWPKALKNISVEKFRKEIKGKKILGAERIGKNIFINLSGGKTIYIHLKMTGHLLVKLRAISNFQFPISKHKDDYFNDRVNQYIHHKFFLVTRNAQPVNLEFSDLRKFGKIILVETKKIKEMKEIKNLGIDALSEKFTFEKFQEILKKKENKKIREILMDQQIISGIGNIYASEILFEARISPKSLAKDIGEKEAKLVHSSIKSVLKKAVKMRGTSDSDYRDTSGKPGNFQKVLKVYQKDGAKCQSCDTIIKRVKIGQRSAFYCPKCQK